MPKEPSAGVADSSLAPFAPAGRPMSWLAVLRRRYLLVDRETAGLLAILALAWIVACVVINPVGNFPINDDWAFGIAVKTLVQTGHFKLADGTSVDLLLQALWGALFCLPFGFSFTALRISTQVLGLAGALAMFGLVREAGGSRRTALLGALTLAGNPLYFGLANSFMTDVPFLALTLISLFLFVRGVRLNSPGWLGGGVALAIATVLLRQFAALELAAFGIAYVFRYGISRKTLTLAILPFVLGIALHLGYQHWMLSTGRIAGFDHPAAGLLPPSVHALLQSTIRCLAGGATYTGFMMAPFLLVLLVPAVLRQGFIRSALLSLVILAAAVFLFGIDALFTTRLPQVGNALNVVGMGPFDILSASGPIAVLPPWLRAFWLAANGIGVVVSAALILLVAVAGLPGLLRLVRHEFRQRVWFPALLGSLLGSYGLVVVLLGTTTVTWDRYFLPFAPLVSLIALCAVGNPRPSRLAGAGAVLMLVLTTAFSLAATHDYLAQNRARWRATDALLASGVSPQEVDGGYEFHGWYTSNEYDWHAGREYAVAATPMPHYAVMQRYAFDRWLTFKRDEVLVLRRVGTNPMQAVVPR